MALTKQQFEDKFTSLLSKFMLDTIKELQTLKDPNDLVLKIRNSALNISKTITEYIDGELDLINNTNSTEGNSTEGNSTEGNEKTRIGDKSSNTEKTRTNQTKGNKIRNKP
jgi:hypothetical protein